MTSSNKDITSKNSRKNALNISQIVGNGFTVKPRKTSAEIVSEAKILLAGNVGGARLVSTRRPITPHESDRRLYGKLAPAGRPPSAFSLRHLRFDNRQILPLEPIQTNYQTNSNNDSLLAVKRSASIGIIFNCPGSFKNLNNQNRPQVKLPALTLPPQIMVSSEKIPERKLHPNCNSGQLIILENIPKKETEKSLSSEERPTTLKENLCQSQCDSQKIKLKEDKEINLQQSRIITSKTLLVKSNDLLVQSSTEILLDHIKVYAGIKECSENTAQHINAILTEIHSRINGTKNNWRGLVLSGLHGLVECTSPKVLLAVARLVLSLNVTGSNLTGACKLVFKVARSEANDYLFIESDVPELLINGLGRASPIDDPEACIYGYGAVRFLVNTNKRQLSDIDDIKQIKSIGSRLVVHGAVPLIVLHLQILNEFGSIQNLFGPPLHALFQVSAALRALAGLQQDIYENLNYDKNEAIDNLKDIQINKNITIIHKNIDPKSIGLEIACPHLVKAAEISIREGEIQSNIVRTLSILSENDDCCKILSEYAARIGILLGPYLTMHVEFPVNILGLISRLGYILGNIMAKYDSARIQFYNNDVAMEYLLKSLELHSNKNFICLSSKDNSSIDVLIKLVRVLANMSVNSDVGYNLGLNSSVSQILLGILSAVYQTKNKLDEIDELLQATLGALHNLCFYQSQSENIYEGIPFDSMKFNYFYELINILCRILDSSFNIVSSEAAKVLGNLTRNRTARDIFCAADGLQILLNCLNSNDYELIKTSVGVLVNLLSDWENRGTFHDIKGPKYLYNVLFNAVSKNDWILAAITCQAFWNFLSDSSDIIRSLGEEETDRLTEILIYHLDNEMSYDREISNILFEQFLFIATDLLERIQTSDLKDPKEFQYSFVLDSESSSDENLSGEDINTVHDENFKKWLDD